MDSITTINYKVSLRDSDVTDTRRFSVNDVSIKNHFRKISEKLESIFPILNEVHYKITWKDSDGDEVTITSDEELCTAVTEMTGNIKLLYVTVLNKNEENFANEPVIIEADLNLRPQRSIICDVCQCVVDGFRYKCLECPDYDLCSECEHKGHHSEHLMVRMVITDSCPRFTRKFMHHISRCMKKSTRGARKDAHKSGRGHPSFAHPKKCFQQTGCSSEKPESTNFEDGNKDNNDGGNNEGRCPFTGENINMENIHNFTKQHFNPLWSVLNPQNLNQERGSDQPPLFYDVIQNAVDIFFGRYQEPPKQNEQKKDQVPPSNQNEKESTTTNATTNATTTATPTPTAMDFEFDSQNTRNQDAAAPPAPTENHPGEPGWAYVVRNIENPSTNSPPEKKDSSSVTAPNPTVIYHNNPVIAEGLAKLHEMGFFNDNGTLTRLLEHYKGDINEVIKALFDLKI